MFFAGDVALDVAESQLATERQPIDVALPQAVEVAKGEFALEPLPPEFSDWLPELAQLATDGASAMLAECVPRRDFATSAYRLSLLSLLDETSTDAELEEFTALRLRIDGGSGARLAVNRDGVRGITDACLHPVDTPR